LTITLKTFIIVFKLEFQKIRNPTAKILESEQSFIAETYIEGREKRQQQPAQQLPLIQLYRSTIIPEHYRLGLAKNKNISKKWVKNRVVD
jgi:hypothetical protein